MNSIGMSLKDYQLTGPELERFWAKVDKSPECWEWNASVNAGGYGQYTIGRGKNVTYVAHRIAYTLQNGPIEQGKQLDHICHNRRCVNPGHLRPVDHKRNQENHNGPTRISTSGVRGVSWHKQAKRWRGEVRHNDVRYSAGLHRTIAEAEVAVTALRLKLHTHNDMDRVAA